jgi:hypothetical protein
MVNLCPHGSEAQAVVVAPDESLEVDSLWCKCQHCAKMQKAGDLLCDFPLNSSINSGGKASVSFSASGIVTLPFPQQVEKSTTLSSHWSNVALARQCRAPQPEQGTLHAPNKWGTVQYTEDIIACSVFSASLHTALHAWPGMVLVVRFQCWLLLIELEVRQGLSRQRNDWPWAHFLRSTPRPRGGWLIVFNQFQRHYVWGYTTCQNWGLHSHELVGLLDLPATRPDKTPFDCVWEPCVLDCTHDKIAQPKTWCHCSALEITGKRTVKIKATFFRGQHLLKLEYIHTVETLRHKSRASWIYKEKDIYTGTWE